MAIYNIYEIVEDEFVAIPADESGPDAIPDGKVEINIKNEWVPGSHQDIRATLMDKALEKWLDKRKKIA